MPGGAAAHNGTYGAAETSMGELVCVAVCKRGTVEVVCRLTA